MYNSDLSKASSVDALGRESIPRLMLKYTSATLIALLLNAVYNLTDTLFVSWGVGDNAMGGVSVVLPFVLLQGAISTAVGGGAASIVSRKLGAGKTDEAGKTTFNAMVVFYLTALIITATGFALINPLLNLFGVTAELYSAAKNYFIIILAGNVFSTGFSSIIRAEGKMLYGTLIWIIPITINIILDAIFIFALGWGVRGSAAATVICQFTSFLMCILFFTKYTSQNIRVVKPIKNLL
jgi:Na+-driven multidrug efflux pump